MTRDSLLNSYIALFAFEHLPRHNTINNWFPMTTFASLEMAICKNKQLPHNDVRHAAIKRRFCTMHSMNTIYTLYILHFTNNSKVNCEKFCDALHRLFRYSYSSIR